jgi:hypothetical protein
MTPRYKENWFESTFDTPEKRAKFLVYYTYAQIFSWIMIVIGIVLFILIVGGVIQT